MRSRGSGEAIEVVWIHNGILRVWGTCLMDELRALGLREGLWQRPALSKLILDY